MNHVTPAASATTTDVDVLIIGSGPVGSSFARTIYGIKPDARILMIDVGPQLTTRPGMNVRNIADAEAREGAQVRSQGPTKFPYSIPNLATRVEVGDTRANVSSVARPGTHLVVEGHAAADGMPAAAASTNVGGMGAHWTCACPRPADSETVGLVSAEEWERLFRTAESLLQVTATAFPPTEQGRRIESKLTGIFSSRLGERKVQAMPLACSVDEVGRLVWAGADTVLGPLAAPENRAIELWSETLCRTLLVEGGHVRGARVEHLPSHAMVEIRAKVAVVAADALRTPQLLWASGIRSRALGHYLNDQPQIVSVVRLPAVELDVELNAKGAFKAPFGVFWVPYSDPEHPFHGQVMHVGTSPIPLAATEENEGPASFLTLGWFCAKEMRFEDRIEFSDCDRDYLGMPAPTIHYGLSNADWRHVGEAIACVQEAADALGAVVDGYEARMIPAGSSLHYQGSTRMGDDPDDSVCDTYSRVWDFDNLFVGGNGVIPTATACNPTLTSCALAVRSAEYLCALLP